MRVWVTGGAGFIGSSVALGFAARHSDWEIIALDNLRRRGSELNLPRLRDAGIAFVHGDVRVLDDLLAVGEIDTLVECSAEPSVLAGTDGSPEYVVSTNLIGAYHCLELARRRGAQLVFPRPAGSTRSRRWSACRWSRPIRGSNYRRRNRSPAHRALASPSGSRWRALAPSTGPRSCRRSC